MKKTYKVRMYFINKNDGDIDYSLYTKKMLIDKLNTITNSNFKKLNDAIDNLKRYNNLDKWSIIETYIEISNNDIIGNIKPDNSFTDTLELGKFKNIIDSDSYIVREFSKLNNNQKLNICEFIDKNHTLLEELNIQLQFTPDVIKRRFINIIENSVYELFLSTDEDETQYTIQRMEIFNNIQFDKLCKFLNETIENLTVKQLLDNDDYNINTISNEFWNKILEENNKEKELTND
jgi:hypothetical protein